MSLTQYVNSIISNTLANIDKSQQLQTEIHPEIHFKYNYINLLISRRNVGKTFSILKKLIKLSHLPNRGGYTTFLYVSDKTNDATVNELINHIKLHTKIIKYNKILLILHDLIDAKNAYDDILNKNIQNEISKNTKKNLFETLDLNDWTKQTPHTAILLHDAINILKDNKFKQLKNLLFQNKQPKLTIFICAQNMFGIPVQIKKNCDNVWLFAGMTNEMMFSMIMTQVGLNGKNWWENYSKLNFRNVMIIKFSSNGTKIKFLKN
jgi:hypothetical protein